MPRKLVSYKLDYSSNFSGVASSADRASASVIISKVAVTPDALAPITQSAHQNPLCQKMVSSAIFFLVMHLKILKLNYPQQKMG